MRLQGELLSRDSVYERYKHYGLNLYNYYSSPTYPPVDFSVSECYNNYFNPKGFSNMGKIQHGITPFFERIFFL